MHYLIIEKDKWEKSLEDLLESNSVYASIQNEFGLDYELLKAENIPSIIYNKPKPAIPLKSFFLPVKENVTSDRKKEKQRIIIGIPNCDIVGLSLLDELYLSADFRDPFYNHLRENTILISSDCFGIQEYCHCQSYNVKPWSAAGADMAIISMEDKIILRIITGKGEEFATFLSGALPLNDEDILSFIEEKHKNTEALLTDVNKGLPDYKSTGRLVESADNSIWMQYSAKCVSCGACTTICPTCSCFLLIDKPGFEKVKQMDACQYPGFERVAGGEDVLFELRNRFRNRYMCKYVWKPEKFRSLACTGCGRCIEACLGKINKNEIFMDLAR